MKKKNLLAFVAVSVIMVVGVSFFIFAYKRPLTITPYNIFKDSSKNVTNFGVIQRDIKTTNGTKIDSTVYACYILEGDFKLDSTSLKQYVLHFIDTSKFNFPMPETWGTRIQIEFYKTSWTTKKDIIPDEYNTDLNEDLVAEINYTPPGDDWYLTTFSDDKIVGTYKIIMQKQKVISVTTVHVNN